MDYSYEVLDVTLTKGILVEYSPPAVFSEQLPVTRVWLPWPIDSLTDAAEIRARVESAVPIEDWEELLNRRITTMPDFSELISAGPRSVTLSSDLVAKSKRERRVEQSVVAPVSTAPGPIEV